MIWITVPLTVFGLSLMYDDAWCLYDDRWWCDVGMSESTVGWRE